MGRGLARSRALGEHALTQAYSQATLDALEARGVTHFGTVTGHKIRGIDDAARKQAQTRHPRTGQYAVAHVALRERHCTAARF
jgi:hypothetical protein